MTKLLSIEEIEESVIKLDMSFYFRDEIIRQYENKGFELIEVRHCFKTNTTSAKMKKIDSVNNIWSNKGMV